jgi:hypothetical protein
MEITNMPSTFIRTLFLTCLGLSLVACDSLAQQRPDGRGRSGVVGGPPGFGPGGPLELLQRPDVQTELELLDDQTKELGEVVLQFNEQRRELLMDSMRQFRDPNATDADREALRGKIQEDLRALNEETEAGLTFLLPHQRRRLSQLEIQFRMRAGGGLGALGSQEIVEQLGVTEEQREMLRSKAVELGQEFSQKIAELRREMQDKLLAELNPDQRAKFQEMLGDPFEFQDRPPGAGSRPGSPSGGARP